MGSKPPAAVVEHISKDERHGLGDAAPFSIKTSSLKKRSGSSTITPNQAELIFSPGSIRVAEQLSPCIA